MKKLFILTLAALTVAGYSQAQIIAEPKTTQTQDTIALQKANIVALDLRYQGQTNVAYVQYQAQRNMMVRQLDKMQSTNSPVTISSPSSTTPSN